MRNLYLVVFLLVSIPVFSQISTSRVFQRYQLQYQDLIVYSIPEWGPRDHYRILGFTGKGWELIDYYAAYTALFQDSIIKKPFPNQAWVLNEIMQARLTELPTEADLKEPCFRKQYFIEGKDTSVSIVSTLGHFSHPDYHRVAYQLQGKKGEIVYAEINEAAVLCPDQQERKRFRDIIYAIKMAGAMPPENSR